MIYLAAPYNDRCKIVIQHRMEIVYRVMAEYIKRGDHILTPLSMHEVAIRHNLDGSYSYWENYCLNILKRCDKLVVLRLEGWDASKGVRSEIEFATNNCIPIEYIDYLE